MKLSEAIRLGAMSIPQTRGNYKGCAFGAATYAMGRNWHYSKLLMPDVSSCTTALWPWIETVVVRHPRGESMSAKVAILILNDTDGWTRERIADWVESIEPQEAWCADEVRQGQEVGA